MALGDRTHFDLAEIERVGREQMAIAQKAAAIKAKTAESKTLVAIQVELIECTLKVQIAQARAHNEGIEEQMFLSAFVGVLSSMIGTVAVNSDHASPGDLAYALGCIAGEQAATTIEAEEPAGATRAVGAVDPVPSGTA